MRPMTPAQKTRAAQLRRGRYETNRDDPAWLERDGWMRRTYYAATARLRQRHAEEFARLLAEERGQ